MPTKREMLFVLIGAVIALGIAFAFGRLSVSKPADASVVVLETVQITASSDGGSVDAGHLDAGAVTAHADAGHDAGK